MGRITKDTTKKVEGIVEKKVDKVPVVKARTTAKKEAAKKTVDKSLDLMYNGERKKKSFSGKRRGKLDIPAEYQDPRFTLRWVKNNGDRINELKANDWFVLQNSKLAEVKTGKSGSNIQIHGGLDTLNKEQNLILMAKRKDWYEEDAKEKAQIVRDTEAAINVEKDKIENSYGDIKKK